ncbi:MAG: alpha-isopropylmalate synthase regulatory domain-containing protein, partial [Varibaculum cambriense]|nr:alpha-isopropylmalate synthase regulatory domain-containing protein [Varibaculum cambriense]
DYVEHAMETGESSRAAAYVEAEIAGQVLWGVGIDPSITRATYKAVISALNRAER